MTAKPVRLLADIGGTNVRFGLQRSGEPARHVDSLRCADFPGPVEAARRYLADKAPDARPCEAAFAAATADDGDRISLTNHPWTFSVEESRKALGLDRLVVINDFTAIALSLPNLETGDLRQVGGGLSVPGAPLAVLGPGTGLGVSGLIAAPDGTEIALSTEGGHATLAPENDREGALLGVLRQRFEHVSAERVLSGPGLVNLHGALAELDGQAAATADPAAITARALAGDDPLAVETLEMFCAFLGSVAGNLALTLGARGGVYIAGGIVPALGDAFAQSTFRERFEAKGRFRAYLAAIPTFVITHRVPALVGLAALLDRETADVRR